VGEVLVELLCEVPGKVLALPAATSQLPAPLVTVNERHREYPALGLIGNRRQQGNLANDLPNYTTRSYGASPLL